MNVLSLRNTVLRSFLRVIPFSLIKRTDTRELTVVYYHIVNDEDVPHISNLYHYKRTHEFVEDIEFLLKQYTPVGMQDVIRWGKGIDRLPSHCFLLTVDDGLREIYDVMSPILTEKGIPAAFFVSSAFLDNEVLFHNHKKSLLVHEVRKGISPGARTEIAGILLKNGVPFSQLEEGILKVNRASSDSLDRIAEVLQVDFNLYLKQKEPYLTSSQVNMLIDRGFTIGAHSIDHPHYSEISQAEQLEQTIGSVKVIREKYGLDYGAFSFPHTDAGVSLELLAKIRESGLIDITFGTDGMADTGMRSHRPRVSLEKPLRPARELLAWHYARRLHAQWKR